MDFACRSFASRLERRRNVLITAQRFSRLAGEYLERSDELLISLERNDTELERRLEQAEEALRQLHEDSEALGEVERECVREGERLSDLLVMPVKDALGRHLAVERAADTARAQRLLQQVCARAAALRERVARHRLLLRQAALVRCYEADAAQAAAWLRQLGAAMRDQVGCSVAEIQRQKEQHQDFQHTAKGSYEYGRQLVQAALALRQCCRLATAPNEQLSGALDAAWRRLDAAAQEHVTRLRVSAVFHRSVDQHCEQLRELIAEASGAAPAAQEEAAGACRRARAQRLLAAREKLLLEVGRMVRLGRLLRTRLREPLAASDREDEEDEEQRQQQEGPGGNATAVDAISERLAEVAELAERLDAALCAGDVSVRRVLDSENWGSGAKPGDGDAGGGGGAAGERSDDDFLTASECTCTRSSSFHTASECASGGGAASPSSWWEEDQSEEQSQPQQLVTTSVEERQGVIVHEVTETRTLKLSHSPSFGITSYHMTHEITDSAEPKAEKGAASISKETHDSAPALDIRQKKQDFEENTEEEIKLEDGLKESGEWLQLKLLEAAPDLTKLGADLREAEELRAAHAEVLRQLQSKQSPVEELLRQADQVISTQRPRAEVYAAMAQSLGRAWADVNAHLDLRRQLLDLNVSYHRHAASCSEAMRVLEVACDEASGLPTDAESAKEALSALHEARRVSLESLMPALQDGRALLDKLRELVALGTLDSRPNAIRVAASYANSQVEHWMEALHDRRQQLELAFSRRRERLEQCLALMLVARDLRALEDAVDRRRHELADVLGDSAASAEILLAEHRRLLPEAKEFQDRGVKITKATEQLVSSDHFAAEEAVAQAYKVLQQCAEYSEALDNRENLLQRAISFFRTAHTAMQKLDQLEQQLKMNELPVTSPQLAKMHAAAVQTIEDVTDGPLKEGYALLDAAGHSMPGSEGIKRAVEELENRKISLNGLCIAHKEEHLRVSLAMQTYKEKEEEIFSWIVQIAEAFLQGHQDMGSVLAMAQDFLQLHQQLLGDVQEKGNEINNLLLTLPPILEVATDEERAKIDEKVEALHNLWLNLKNVVEARIYLAQIYVKFHTVAVDLANEFDALDDELKKSSEKISDETIRNVEQKWLYIQQLYTQLQSIGNSVKDECSKIGDPYLDTKRAALCVDTLLEHFGGRQLTLTQSWQTWQSSVTVERETQILWERSVIDCSKTYDWASKLDGHLYPVMTSESSSSKVIVRELEDKLQTVLPELKKAQTEIELRVKTAENLVLKGESQGQKEEMTAKLIDLHGKLQVIATDYQILLQMLIAFFKNLAELEKTIENLESQYRHTRLPSSVSDIELLLKEHEASRQAVLELFKFTQNEKEQIVIRIKQQEPDTAAKHDIDSLTRLLEIKRIAWESAWTDRKLQIEQHRQLCQFDSDLHQINATLNDLSRQLDAIKGQYGESLVSAKATSQAFVYFEKTIELLEVRIQTFVSTAENMLSTEHVPSPHVEHELKQLQSRWQQFHNQVVESRRLIDLSMQYFTLVEEAEEWFREGSKLLVTIARKSTSVKKPDEATQLLAEVDTFLKPGELRQDERIRKISTLAIELYGEERSKQVSLVLSENKEMLDSFTVISEELNTLARNLKAAEEQREKQREEQQAVEASLAAARAEAAAAQAAAAAAEEARRAAESAAKLLKETSVTVHKVDVEMQVAMPETKQLERPQKSPSPPLKKAKIVTASPKNVGPVFSVPLNDAVIQEGEKFTFRCCVTGTPMPEVIWYKDGISIQNNPDYQTTFKDGNCSLTIEETFTEDSAKFTCKATNAAGTAETSATLSVKEAEPEEQLSPPHFTQPLQNSSAREGSSHELRCHVEGIPLPTVQWFKDGTCVDASPDYVITFNNGEALLRFEEVFLEDQAEYSCRATNPLGSDSCCARLTVEPLEPTETPAFIVPLTNVMARAGQKIKLECEVTGLPSPQISWSHNNKPVKETRDLKVQYENNKATLVITEAFPKDAGIYVVTAKNIAGEASSSCNVSVKGRLPTETSDSELASDMEPTKPSIQVPLKDIIVFEGKRARLDCVIVGQPEPEVIWYHDDRPVKESTDIQLLFQGDRCSLIIQEAYLDDAGEYKVVAINSAGEANSKCSLSVKSLADTEPKIQPKPPEVTEEASGKAPKFTKLLADVMVSETESAVLDCCVEGDPLPEIKWFLNNCEIKPDAHRVFQHDKDGNVSLTIKSTSPEDKGVYTVKATNKNGEAKCFSNLIIKSSGITEVRSKVDKQVFPAFKELFADRTAYAGDSTKFECIVTGKPTPKVKWYFNDEPVSGKDFLVSTSGERQVLTIPCVANSHAGKVACVAENEVGKATCLALLTVQDPPTLPSLLNSNISEQIESSSFSVKRSVFMQSSTSQVTSSTLTTGTEPKVEVHSYSSESQESFKQSGGKPPVQVESHKTVEVHQVDKDKPDIHQTSFLKVSNAAEESQESSTSSYSTPVASPKPVRKSVGPRFISPLNGVIVDQGADVVLEGIIDGYPQPEVSWTKNGQPLIAKEGSVNISWKLNKARVELKNVVVKDAGRYTCTASNKAGSASSTADVVVKKTVFPPVFGRRLQAQVVKVGDRVVMEVEVTGTPEPVITWMKDGEIIKSGDQYRLKSQGNCHSLIIEKVSLPYSGKYTVKAKNSGGEAQCIADFVVYQPEPTTEVVKNVIFEDIVQSETQKQTHLQSSTSKVISENVTPVQQIKRLVDTSSGLVPGTQSFVSESLSLTEHKRSEKHVSVKIDRSSSPSFQKVSLEETKTTTAPVETPISVTVVDGKSDQHVPGTTHEYTVPITLEEKSRVPPATIPEKKGGAFACAEDKPKSTLEKVTEEPVKPQPTKKSEPEKFMGTETTVSSTEIEKSVSVTETALTEKKTEETGIEDAPISKKSAFDFFVAKLKDNEEQPIKPKQPAKEDELPTRGTVKDAVKSFSVLEKKEEAYSVPIKEVTDKQKFTESQIQHIELPTSTYESLKKSQFQSEKVVSSTFSVKHITSSDSFDLIPEPPPEIGYIPKTETSKKAKEDVTTRVRKLEEGHRILSDVEIPAGGVKIFPTPSKESERKEQEIQGTKPAPSWPPAEHEKITSDQKKSTIKEVQEEVCVQKKVVKPGLVDSSQPSRKQEPKKEIPSSQPHVTISPWISRKTSELPQSEVVPSAHLSSVPKYESSLTKISSSESTQKISSLITENILPTARPVSPKPSAEGIAMEKLWTPHKQPEPDTIIIRPSSDGPHLAERATSPKPSMEGLAMDKLWAHKHPDAALKKSWPPPPTTEDKPIIPWVSKGSTEKQWPPPQTTMVSEKVETKTQKTESSECKIISSKQPVMTAPTKQQPTEDIVKTTTDLYTKSAFQPVQTPDYVKHYIAETKVHHSSAMDKSETHVRDVTKIDIKSEQKEEMTKYATGLQSDTKTQKEPSPPVVEENILKPSEVKKTWPPGFKEDFEMKAPPKRKSVPNKEVSRPTSMHDTAVEPLLEPGPPPEIGFARPPPLERRQSYVETIEKDLEKDLEKEPTRHLAGAVRTIPPPPQKERSLPPQLHPKQKVDAQPDTSKISILSTDKCKFTAESKTFERFPDLEPFPFKPDAPKPKQKLPPPPKPSKFVKGEFGGSDYESDFESTHIPPKWRPYESDTEDIQYRRVKPPVISSLPKRPKSTEPEPPPPSKFDKPPQFQGPPRPDVKVIRDTKIESVSKTESKIETKIEKQSKFFSAETRKISPPPLRQGSPPVFVQAVPPPEHQEMKPTVDSKKPEQKPDSPKSKTKMIRTEFRESGYMADTDEPRQLNQISQKSSSMKQEEFSKTSISQTTLITEKISVQNKQLLQQQKLVSSEKPSHLRHHSSVRAHHRHSEHKAEKKTTTDTSSKQDKEISSTVVTKELPGLQQASRDDRDSSLEPFPFEPEAPRTVSKRVPKAPPPPSPSKFVKGEFRESDYESDYEGRIPAKWRPADSDAEEPTYRPVRPILTPRASSRASAGGRTPTPPTEFDNPPQTGGPPRPKFEPIEKLNQSVKSDKTSKSSEKVQVIFKPKPVTPKTVAPMEVITATPAVKTTERVVLEPGSPPEIGYIPPPRTGQKVSKSIFQNATQTETSKVMNFAEETETSRRVMSLQQTTRVIKFGEDDRKKPEPKLEPFPFRPDPDRPRRSSAPPPPKPKKFFPGEFRESDYESDYEGRIKPKWTPANSDTDEPKYRRVRPPQVTRSVSVPSKSLTQVPTPMEFDTQQPYIPSPSESPCSTLERQSKTSAQKLQFETEQRRLRRVEEMKKRFSVTPPSTTTVKRTTSLQDLGVKPGEPPEYGFISPSTATNIASKHMSEMTSTFKSRTQKFVDDIITDMKVTKPDKSILKPATPAVTNGDKEPQAYREESRASQYASPGGSWLGKSPRGRGNTPTPPSTPGSTPTPTQQHQLRRPPVFITPLRDIAVVSGQTARFECIVQAEPAPNILWSKNGRIIENSEDYQLHYRNGVCRLTIPHAFPEDAGSYSCTATNMLGSSCTTATLQVPGEKRGIRK
ncbi:titin isoform X1 [Schistocerca cancellata]|uniref:titin isoform X1 n=1 Tax=Schistocerca cancellata TaxID=274614 RepID=UPI00211860FF|nr:titin isoform X1 [Schistocerca cancellata]